jgi:hypothetical protein
MYVLLAVFGIIGLVLLYHASNRITEHIKKQPQPPITAEDYEATPRSPSNDPSWNWLWPADPPRW